MSNTAGTFVCNQVFYGLMHGLTQGLVGHPAVRAGFIHVPPLGATGDTGVWTLERLVAGVRLSLALSQAADNPIASMSMGNLMDVDPESAA